MVSDMHVRILLMCAFGFDFSQEELDFEHEGKVEKKSVSYVLRTTFHECIKRMSDPHVVIFPFLADCYITPGERAIKRNCRRMREFIFKIVESRRKVIKANPNLKDCGDFLGILLKDDNFHGDNEMIVDECLTFFFAGSQTSSVAAQNLILMLIKHPEIKNRILEELDRVIIQPHLNDLKKQGKLQPGETVNLNVLDFINFDN